MNTFKFKTNINCSGCINAVTPHLNKVEGIREWQVDTTSPDKILTVEARDGNLSPALIAAVVEKAGFKISTVQD